MDNQAKRNQLKQKAVLYLPRNLETIEAQKTLIAMLTAVIPTVKVCGDKAERELWPKVAAGQMTLKSAAGSCAYEVNRILGITVLENLSLEKRPQTDLLRAWVALDYYSYLLKPEYSGNIRKFLERMTDLIQLAPAAAPAAPAQPQHTQAAQQPRDAFKTVAIGQDIQQPAPGSRSANVSMPKTKAQPQKKKTGLVASLAAVAALVILVLALTPVLNKVKEVETAIREIGTVTMESEAAIEKAEQLYEALPESQKGRVENYETLPAAREEYERLEALVTEANAAIDAIGNVTLESGEAIEKARTLYNGLEEEGLTKYLAEKEYILTRAERLYEQCVIDESYAAAAKLLEEKKYEEALKAFEDLIQAHPTCDKVGQSKTGAQECLMVLAQAALERNDLQGAVKKLDAIAARYTPDQAYQELLGKVETRIKSNHPSNGRTFLDKIGWGWGKIDITAGDKDTYVKIEDTKDPTKYMVVFIHANSTASVRVKDGTYSVKYATGKYWYSQELMFGDSAEYFLSGTTYTFTTSYSGSYVYYYSADIDLTDQTTANAKAIKAEEF